MPKRWLVLLTLFIGAFFILILILYLVTWPRLKERNTAALIAVIDEAVEMCHEETGWEPPGEGAQIAEVLFGNNVHQKTYLDPRLRDFLNERGEFVDNWNVPLKFIKEIDDSWEVRSAGRNGIFGDSDDLTADDFFRDN